MGYPEPSALPQGSPSVDVALEITMPRALADLLLSNTTSAAAARQEFEEAFVNDMMATLILPNGAQIEILGVSIREGRRLQPGRRLQNTQSTSTDVSLVVTTRITLPTSASSDTDDAALSAAVTLLNDAISNGLTLTQVNAALESSTFASACPCTITVPQQTVSAIATTDATTGQPTTVASTTTVASGSSSSDNVVEASPATCVASNIVSLIVSV